MAEANKNIISTLGTVLKGGSDVTISANDARTLVLGSAVVGAVGGGMYTRKRAAAGKDPILKILF